MLIWHCSFLKDEDSDSGIKEEIEMSDDYESETSDIEVHFHLSELN